jgi:hypothetical protein
MAGKNSNCVFSVSFSNDRVQVMWKQTGKRHALTRPQQQDACYILYIPLFSRSPTRFRELPHYSRCLKFIYIYLRATGVCSLKNQHLKRLKNNVSNTISMHMRGAISCFVFHSSTNIAKQIYNTLEQHLQHSRVTNNRKIQVP